MLKDLKKVDLSNNYITDLSIETGLVPLLQGVSPPPFESLNFTKNKITN